MKKWSLIIAAISILSACQTNASIQVHNEGKDTAIEDVPYAKFMTEKQ